MRDIKDYFPQAQRIKIKYSMQELLDVFYLFIVTKCQILPWSCSLIFSLELLFIYVQKSKFTFDSIKYSLIDSKEKYLVNNKIHCGGI